MPKAPIKAKPVESAPQASTRGVKVTYMPLEHSRLVPNEQGKLVRGAISYDPPVIKWNGVTFHANIPVALDPEKHFVLFDKPTEIPQVDGTVRTVTKVTRVTMIELCKGSPSFKVDGFPRATRKISTRTVPPPGAEWEEKNEGEIMEADDWQEAKAAAEREIDNLRAA